MKIFLALVLSVIAITPVMASDSAEATTVQVDEAGFAVVDNAAYCSVVLINRNNRVLRRYDGQRDYRTYRCLGPMNACRRDAVRTYPRGSHRCLEVR